MMRHDDFEDDGGSFRQRRNRQLQVLEIERQMASALRIDRLSGADYDFLRLVVAVVCVGGVVFLALLAAFSGVAIWDAL